MIETRKIRATDAAEIKSIISLAFNGIEKFFISKPEDGLVAVIDGKIVGATIVRYICRNGHKIGYFDGAFIHPDYHGQGIGTVLYKATEDYLWEQGCTAQTAFVKDDNVASWKLLLNNSFSQISFTDGAKNLGLKTMLYFYFETVFFAASGMECYLKMKDTAVHGKAVNSTRNIALYLLLNSLFLLLGCIGLQTWVGNDKNYFLYIAAFFTLLAAGVAASFVGTMFTKQKWHFRLNSGGALFSAMFGFLGGVYPMVGNWYPTNYKKTKQFTKDMALPAIFDWLSLAILTAVSCGFADGYLYFQYISSLGIVLLLYKSIYLYPFGAMGGARVYQWKKWGYLLMVGLSIAVTILAITLK